MSSRVRLPKKTINFNIGNKYTITKHLGSGSYAMVWEGVNNETGERVAIKQVTRLFEDLEDTKRMLREVTLLKSLNHPHIVKLKEIIVPNGPHEFTEICIVMEHAPSDLQKLFKSPVDLEEAHIKTITYGILCGVKYMHCANVLHRDIKPANVLINEDCQTKIWDFGLARSLPDLQVPQESDEIEEEATQLAPKKTLRVPPGKACGTAPPLQTQMTGHVVTRWYRAPELILMESHYTKAIDVWSVACIMAELWNMQKANAPTFLDRKPLFPGKSCFPLSPAQGKQVTRAGWPASSSDQLAFIFDILGTPEEEDYNAITDSKAKQYLRSFDYRETIPLQKIYPASNPAYITLIEKVLLFIPDKRLSIEQVLDDPYFDEVRDIEKQNLVPQFPSMEFDEIEDLSFDQLREYFSQIVDTFNANNINN